MIRSRTKIAATTTAMTESGGSGEDALDARSKASTPLSAASCVSIYIYISTFLVPLLHMYSIITVA